MIWLFLHGWLVSLVDKEVGSYALQDSVGVVHCVVCIVLCTRMVGYLRAVFLHGVGMFGYSVGLVCISCMSDGVARVGFCEYKYDRY